MPRFAANLGLLWPELSLLDRVAAAARAGFRAIELHSPYAVPARDMAAACRHHDLTLLGINTTPGDVARHEFGLGAVPGREADFQAAIEQSIDYCVTSGASAIHCLAGVTADVEWTRARGAFVSNLRAALDRASAHGIRLLLEPLNPRDHPGYFYSTLAVAAELIAELDSPFLQLQFDVYHVAVSEGDVLTKLRRYLPLIGNVQIAAVPSRTEPDSGEIAYPAIFAALDQLGYTGWVGCEYRPRDDTDAGLRWMQALGARE
jgi:hydroxypyruvate isomerase